MLWVTFHLFLLLWAFTNGSLKPAWGQEQQDMRELWFPVGLEGLVLCRSLQLPLECPGHAAPAWPPEWGCSSKPQPGPPGRRSFPQTQRARQELP